MYSNLSRFVGLFLAVLLSMARPGQAVATDANPWVALGPFGGPVKLLSIDPSQTNTLFAATAEALFKSSDDGVSWQVIRQDLPQIEFLQTDPGNASVLYAGGAKGVFKSIDRGDTWKPAGTLSDVHGLAIHPTDSRALFSATSRGLYKSNNGGMRWTLMTSLSRDLDSLPAGWWPWGHPRQNVDMVSFDPTSPDTLYAIASTKDSRKIGNTTRTLAGPPSLAKSIDAGKHWQPNHDPVAAACLLIDSGNPSTLYLGTVAYPSPDQANSSLLARGVLKSTNGGETWTESNQGLLAENPSYPGEIVAVRSMVTDPGNPQIIYAASDQSGSTPERGVFKSLDSGAHWAAINAGLADTHGNLPLVNSLLIYPETSSKLLLGSDRGIYQSSDGGSNWQTLTTNIAGIPIYGFAINPSNPDHFVVASNGGPYDSKNSGASWQFISNLSGETTLPQHNSFLSKTSSVQFSPSEPSVIYLVKQSGQFDHDGFFRSRDGGVTWQSAKQQLTGLEKIGLSGFEMKGIRTFVIDPASPDTLFAGIDSQKESPNEPDRVSELRGIYKSTDGGDTWKFTSALQTSSRHFSLPPVHSIVFEPGHSDTLYAATEKGVFKTTDGGSAWLLSERGLGQTPVNTLTPDSTSEIRLYAGTRRGIFRTENGGRSWQAINRGLNVAGNPLPPEVFSIVIDPDDSALIYASTSQGIFKTLNRGRLWSLMDGGAASTKSQRMVLAGHHPKRLYTFSSEGGGVLEYQP